MKKRARIKEEEDSNEPEKAIEVTLARGVFEAD